MDLLLALFYKQRLQTFVISNRVCQGFYSILSLAEDDRIYLMTLLLKKSAKKYDIKATFNIKYFYLVDFL